MNLWEGFEILVVSMAMVFLILSALWGGIHLLQKILKGGE